MASTARTRLLQLQRRISSGLSHRYHHQQQRYSSSPLLKGHTKLPHRLPSSHRDFWSRGFTTTTNPNQRKQDGKSGSHNEVKRNTRTWNYSFVSVERDLRVKFTHTDCGTKMERLVCKKCYETGAVVARCSGCNAFVMIASHDPHLRGDSRMFARELEVFFAACGERLEEGSDETLNCVFEVREEEVDFPEPHSVRVIWDETKTPHTNLVKWVEYDTTVSPTCPCGATFTRRVYRRACDGGLVAVRCVCCKELLVLQDYHGWIQQPSCTEEENLAEWSSKEPGRTSHALITHFEKELEEDSQDSLNYTIEENLNYMTEDSDPSEGRKNVDGSSAIQMNSELVSSC